MTPKKKKAKTPQQKYLEKLKKVRDYKRANPDKYKSYRRSYYLENRESEIQYCREYRQRKKIEKSESR